MATIVVNRQPWNRGDIMGAGAANFLQGYLAEKNRQDKLKLETDLSMAKLGFDPYTPPPMTDIISSTTNQAVDLGGFTGTSPAPQSTIAETVNKVITPDTNLNPMSPGVMGEGQIEPFSVTTTETKPKTKNAPITIATAEPSIVTVGKYMYKKRPVPPKMGTVDAGGQILITANGMPTEYSVEKTPTYSELVSMDKNSKVPVTHLRWDNKTTSWVATEIKTSPKQAIAAAQLNNKLDPNKEQYLIGELKPSISGPKPTKVSPEEQGRQDYNTTHPNDQKSPEEYHAIWNNQMVDVNFYDKNSKYSERRVLGRDYNDAVKKIEDAGGRLASPADKKTSTTVNLNMEKSTKGKIEQDLYGLKEGLYRLHNMRKEFQPLYLTYGGKGYMFANKVYAKTTGKALNKEWYEKATAFKSNALENINLYIKQITGAQMSEAEADRLRQAVPDPQKDDPVAFKSKLDNLIRLGEAAEKRFNWYLTKGLTKNSIITMIRTGAAQSLDDFIGTSTVKPKAEPKAKTVDEFINESNERVTPSPAGAETFLRQHNVQ